MAPQGVTIDMFTLPNYDDHPAVVVAPPTLSNDNASTVEAYTVQPVVWMLIALVVGYVGVRYFLDEGG